MKNKKLISAVLILVCALFGMMKFGANTPKSAMANVLTISTIDVGQGDCTLVSYAGENMLIDSGTNKSYTKIDRHLKSLGITKLDFLVMTHPHSDHIGAMDDVLENYDVDTFVMADTAAESAVYERVMDLAYIHAEDILTVSTADSVYMGDAKITVLSPSEDFADKNINNMSIVLLLELEDFEAIFCGDAEKNAEKAMLGRGLPQVDFLKVGHHGSYTSSTENFVNALSPSYATISLGRDNEYGYPHELPQKNLKAVGTEVYRTDTQGTITLKYDGLNIDIQTEK